MRKNCFLLLIGILIILTSIFTYKYVKNEAPIYVFDYSGYQGQYELYAEKLLISPSKFLKDTISSVRNADYNCTPILLCIPFYFVFNTSRFGYILAISLLYVVPTISLSILLIKKMLFKKEDNKTNKKQNGIFTIFLCIMAFLYTRWWSPTLRGLPDIIAVIPLLVAALLVNKYSFLEKQKMKIPILVGFILYLCFIFRRYFVYAIIGF